MAQKRLTECALRNVLETAVELLQDADDGNPDGMVTVNNSVCMRLPERRRRKPPVSHTVLP